MPFRLPAACLLLLNCLYYAVICRFRFFAPLISILPHLRFEPLLMPPLLSAAEVLRRFAAMPLLTFFYAALFRASAWHDTYITLFIAATSFFDAAAPPMPLDFAAAAFFFF